MCCKKFATRISTFFLTFAVGLFIASFFVSIAVPNFQFPNRSGRRSHREYDRQRDLENQQLREENTRLKNQQADDSESVNYKYLINEQSPMPSAPPTLKSIPRQGR